MRSLFPIILATMLNMVFATQTLAGTALRSFGDIMQILNPIVAATIASKEMGLGHQANIYAQTLMITHGTKFIANKNEWDLSQRPYSSTRKHANYEGMPSGHTASAWSAAAYVRTFSDDYRSFVIPLYITSVITACSRIDAKEHTVLQVIAGATLAELVTFVNSKLRWSNEYKSTNFLFNSKNAMLSFEFRF